MKFNLPFGVMTQTGGNHVKYKNFITVYIQ
jgi:hypothetical protein